MIGLDIANPYTEKMEVGELRSWEVKRKRRPAGEFLDGFSTLKSAFLLRICFPGIGGGWG